MKKRIFLQILTPIIWTILYLAPIYLYPYRIFINLIFFPAFIISVVLNLIQIIHYLLKKQPSAKVVLASLVSIIISIFIFTSLESLNNLRVKIAGEVIDRYYCRKTTPKVILGGMRENYFEGQKFYINDTHCLFMLCTEEMYNCVN